MIQFQRATPVTGTTVTFEDTRHTQLLIKPAGTLLALTVALPSTPRHGAIFELLCTQIITTLTLTLPTSSTLVGATLTSGAANFSSMWVYNKNNDELIRMR